MTYTHRNGESEPPIEFGFYWVKYFTINDPDTLHWGILGHNEKWVPFMLREVVAFYGPIPRPDAETN